MSVQVGRRAGRPASVLAGTLRGLTARGQSTSGPKARSPRGVWFWRGLVWGGLLVAWQVGAWVSGPFYLPTIDAVLVDGLGEIVRSGYLLTFGDSLRQLLIGFALACAIGIPAGVLIGSSRIARDLLSPYVNTLFVTPTEALLPMIIIMFGTGLEYRVAVVVLFAFFFPLLNSAAGVAAVDRKLLETARAFCTPRRRVFRHILLPAAAPYVVAGIRLGLGMALKGMIIAEMWVAYGTGGLLKNLGAYRQLDVYFALALLVVITAIAVNSALAAYERHLRPWQRSTIGNGP
ncbi:MAG: binding-protein-dependent transporter inner rane component [Actinotalea sp.]|nr:binding-protein-dependent transporter inner rane component [Actinotalea sp.]